MTSLPPRISSSESGAQKREDGNYRGPSPTAEALPGSFGSRAALRAPELSEQNDKAAMT